MTDRPPQTGLVLDERFELHDTGANHPERPERLSAIVQAFAEAELTSRCLLIPPRVVTDETLLAVHPPEYLSRLREHCGAGQPSIDSADSAICPRSEEVARLAAGGVVAAVDAIMSGKLRNAFCAVRPPGHHCEPNESMGFCLLANVAIAARHLLNAWGLTRVAVVDWDVHHGNGTQHIFEDSAAVMVCNLHGHPSYVYPGTGFAKERGTGDGAGATLNIPFYPGAGDEDYRRGFDEQLLPALEDFRPEFVLISAGFDAHRQDPLAPLNLESSSFRWMTEAVVEMAERFSRGRVVSVLEGGYDLQALGESATNHVAVLVDRARKGNL